MSTTTTLAASAAADRALPSPPVRRLLGSLRAEAIRLRRPSFTWLGLLLVVFFTAIASAKVYSKDGERGVGGGGIDVDLESAAGVTAGLTEASTLIGILVLSLWAAATASDYSTGLIRVLVQAEPRRWPLLAGKVGALAAFTTVGTLVATAVAVPLAFPLAEKSDLSTEAWTDGLAGTVVSGWVNLTLAIWAWGVIGLAVAAVSRSVTVAVAGGIGYLMVFEGILGALTDDGIDWLPGSVLSAVAAGGDSSLSYGSALLLGSLYMVAALAVAGAVTRSRDVTS